jgi:hypothetical protein
MSRRNAAANCSGAIVFGDPLRLFWLIMMIALDVVKNTDERILYRR